MLNTSRKEPSDGVTALSIDEVHTLLGARRRRYTLYCLYLYSNPLTLPDVADRVTEWEFGTPAEERLNERLRVYMSLYHMHVPPLVDANVVVYSQTEDMVELGPAAAQLRPYLERAAETDLATDGWPTMA